MKTLLFRLFEGQENYHIDYSVHTPPIGARLYIMKHPNRMLYECLGAVKHPNVKDTFIVYIHPTNISK